MRTLFRAPDPGGNKMTLTIDQEDRSKQIGDDRPVITADRDLSVVRVIPRALVPAAATFGAGVIHATAIGEHASLVTLRNLFIASAIVQVFIAALTLRTDRRLVLLTGAAVNLACAVTYVLATTTGISFIKGLETAETVDAAGAITTGLEIVAALCFLMMVSTPFWRAPGRFSSVLVVAAVTALAVPAMVNAAGTGEGHTHSHDVTVAVAPFDPTKKVDLSGVTGVSSIQQARAEKLLQDTLDKLPMWADYKTAEAAGYRSIGDGYTGTEHFMKWDAIDDDDYQLDPTHPESIVYSTAGGNRTLEAAMYIMPTKMALDQVPDIGGPLTQFHIHDNLCFSDNTDAPQVIGLTSGDGSCPTGKKFTPAAMIHVWITKNQCGPFAALPGVAGGQVQAGTTKSCDHVHDGSFTF